MSKPSTVKTEDIRVVAIGPYCWGKGKTITEAHRNAKQNWSVTGHRPTLTAFNLFVTDDPDAYVNEMGDITFHVGCFCRKVQTSRFAA